MSSGNKQNEIEAESSTKDNDLSSFGQLSLDEDSEEFYNSTHFSTTEERFIKDHDLKVKAFEALHNGNGNGKPTNTKPTSKTIRRRQSFIDLNPNH